MYSSLSTYFAGSALTDPLAVSTMGRLPTARLLWVIMPQRNVTPLNSALIVKETKTRILAPVIDESLAHFIMRMAIINDGSSVNPVMEGIFALSSLLLLGPSKSQSHKSRLISMLQKNVTRMDREGVLQNLIATMLLYQCEVYTLSLPTIIDVDFDCFRSAILPSQEDYGGFISVARRKLSLPLPNQLHYISMIAPC